MVNKEDFVDRVRSRWNATCKLNLLNLERSHPIFTELRDAQPNEIYKIHEDEES